MWVPHPILTSIIIFNFLLGTKQEHYRKRLPSAPSTTCSVLLLVISKTEALANQCWLQHSLEVARLGHHAWTMELGCAWQQNWGGKWGFGGIPCQEPSSGLQPNSESEIIFQVGSLCSQSFSYYFLEGMRLVMGVSQSPWDWLEHWWLHLCKELVGQIRDFRGMKSSALPSTGCMKQGPNGCLMMSGRNWWKNREKLKHVGVEHFFFFFLFHVLCQWAISVIHFFFPYKFFCCHSIFHLLFSCIFPSVPLFPVGKQKIQKRYKVHPFQYNWTEI